jgi:hypothetical protein
MTWRVLDCPDHPQCALGFQDGELCLACGSAIVDGLAGPVTIPAPPRLVQEAKLAWQGNPIIRDFTTAALERYPKGEDDEQEV